MLSNDKQVFFGIIGVLFSLIIALIVLGFSLMTEVIKNIVIMFIKNAFTGVITLILTLLTFVLTFFVMNYILKHVLKKRYYNEIDLLTNDLLSPVELLRNYYELKDKIKKRNV